MEFVFILVEPAVPENIGAACRAIKTMGFNRLRLINPANHLANEAKWLAHGSNDILESAELYNTLEDSLHDIDFSVGTTAKNRSVKLDYYTPTELKQFLNQKKTSLNKVAIIFGREESGLSNNELKLCDLAVTIPLKAPYPSVNLAQAVMILSYALSDCELNSDSSKNNTSDYTLLKNKLKQVLNLLDLNESHNLYGRIMERIATANSDDINLMLSIINRLDKRLK